MGAPVVGLVRRLCFSLDDRSRQTSNLDPAVQYGSAYPYPWCCLVLLYFGFRSTVT